MLIIETSYKNLAVLSEMYFKFIAFSHEVDLAQLSKFGQMLLQQFISHRLLVKKEY